MAKKEWLLPKLIILTKGNQGESVLLQCKTFGTGPIVIDPSYANFMCAIIEDLEGYPEGYCQDCHGQSTT